ncbi:MAG: DUF3089 domain-containing protein [Elusimicrobiales bacterium]|nr:DUF3089 domain-containing protein [Elusimicrobiales bacterium]
MKKINKISALFLACLQAVLICGCGRAEFAGQFGTPTEASIAAQAAASTRPDYSQKNSWIIAENENSEFPADVFYLYPTTYVGKGIKYMDTSSEKDRRNAADYSFFNMGLFEGSANRFAPFYRQASLETFMLGSYEASLPYLRLPCGDALAAFDYYIKHYNKGRPFIIAGFSQGAMMSECIIKNRLGSKKLRKKFIAAYLFGHSISPETMQKYPQFRQSESPADSGVFISINTHLPGAEGILTIMPGSISNDPVSWQPGVHKIDMAKYKGSVMLKDMRTKETESDPMPFKAARINAETGGIELTDVRPEYVKKALKILGDKSMHSYDFMFFYNNIKENVPERISSFNARR